MFIYKWVVTISIRSVFDRSELRWAIVYVNATTPQRAAGHRAVWEARSRVLENMTEGDWYVETSVVRDAEAEKAAATGAQAKRVAASARGRAPLYDMRDPA